MILLLSLRHPARWSATRNKRPFSSALSQLGSLAKKKGKWLSSSLPKRHPCHCRACPQPLQRGQVAVQLPMREVQCLVIDGGIAPVKQWHYANATNTTEASLSSSPPWASTDTFDFQGQYNKYSEDPLVATVYGSVPFFWDSTGVTAVTGPFRKYLLMS
mmetsp:Transcript_3223/g.5668  ORF Transcript_3223/g.5668 Transcript_3223/m.5668 type:complete len:159 (-) Transcript_3223:401-877(-)